MSDRKMSEVLRCAYMQKLYDEADINSIYSYARKIEGLSLYQILRNAQLTREDIAWVQSKEADKGLPGKIIEASYFGYELNGRQEADFNSAGAELKTTAADYDSKTGTYKSGETLSITQIDFTRPVEEDFYSSHVYEKLKMMIVIFYHRDKSLKSKLDYTVFYASLFQPSETDKAIIMADYRDITQKIKAGQAHTLSRKDGIYLSTAPKSKNKNTLIEPYYGGEPLVKRGYTLRKEYVNIILAGYYSRPTGEEKLITNILELKAKSFEDILRDRLFPFLGEDIRDIVTILNDPAQQSERIAALEPIDLSEIGKGTMPQIAARMLGLTQLRSEELTKSGIVVKTVFFNENGNNKEKFRLADASFMEIYNAQPDRPEDDDADEEVEHTSAWEESELYSILDGIKYLLVVFQQNKNGEIIFKGSRLWAMSDEDIELARQDWLDMHNILHQGVQLTIGNNGVTNNNFPGIADARMVHLRPHARNAYYEDAEGNSWGNGQVSDSDVLPDGRRMTRQSYWLNNSLIRGVVADMLDGR